jgi:hypothetical protein
LCYAAANSAHVFRNTKDKEMLGHTLHDALYVTIRKMKKHIRFFSILFYSIGMCRMRRFFSVLRSSFHSSLSRNFPPALLHQLFFHPPSHHLAIYFVVYILVLLFPNYIQYSFGNYMEKYVAYFYSIIE